jgi:HAD superfamily phosphoserine phosphatase-like hydrolase
MKLDLYDFDGTIYDGDSGVDLILFSIKKKPSLIFYYIGSLWIVIKFMLKLIKKEEMKNRIFGFLKYFPDTDKFVKEFWECHEHKMKEFWTSKKSHKNDIIISASGRFWLEPIAEKYKVRELFATDIDPKTGKVSGNNCHGKEKVKIFREKYPDARLSFSEEHTTIFVEDSGLKVGDRLRYIPGHCCTTINTFDKIAAVKGQEVVAIWNITSRGKAQ